VKNIVQPDEDAIEELNLSQVNMNLIKDQCTQNKKTLDEIADGKSSILKPLCARIRSAFGFLQKTILVFSCEELINDWDAFLSSN